MDLNIDFFNITNSKLAKSGRILVSEPFLSDNYFRRSVVYLTEHTGQGSLGFVLNKLLDVRIHEIIDDFPELKYSISLGGPVSTDSLHYIHTLGDLIPESVHVKDGVFWGGDFEAMRELVKKGSVKEHQLRFFLGYSGWSERQLEDELDANAWLVGDINAELVMTAGDSEFWSSILSGFEKKYQAWANFPEDPGLN